MTEQTPREGLYARQSAPQAADGLPEGRGRERAADGREGLRAQCTCLGLPMGPGQECHAHQLPPAHNAGPTIAECAEADRRWWGGEKTGEQ